MEEQQNEQLQQMQQHIDIRNVFPVHNLHIIWNAIEPEKRHNPLTGKDEYGFGNRGVSKMITFAAEVELKNMDIDYWMAITPARKEYESKEEYKLRLKFQKELLKYRSTIYKYSEVTAKKKKAERKRLQKQTLING